MFNLIEGIRINLEVIIGEVGQILNVENFKLPLFVVKSCSNYLSNQMNETKDQVTQVRVCSELM